MYCTARYARVDSLHCILYMKLHQWVLNVDMAGQYFTLNGFFHLDKVSSVVF